MAVTPESRAVCESFLDWLHEHAPYAEGELVTRALGFAEEAHRGQKRRSGDPYLSHGIEVAKTLANLHLDASTIAGGLLHDVVEDTRVTLEEVRTRFGEEIANLVDGVTRMGGFSVQSREREQIETYRKMLLSMARDIRVILIKLADRLHNMRTLEFLDPADRKRIARQTLDIYAPLAHRFGIGMLKWELEDLAFKHLEPDTYRDIAGRVALTRAEREAYIAEVVEPVGKALREQGVEAEITGRPKNFYSIYRKMMTREVPFEEMYDLFAVRIVVNTVPDCYHALGVIHTLYSPLHERIKDYIATPKMNMYQSLHTAVVGPRNRRVELQIRTKEMHRTADYGIAAHWRYKEGRSDRELDEQMQWLRQVLEWQKDLTDPAEFMRFLKLDLFHQEVFVFTPKGELRRLPRGSTPIDFAFAVHTQVGFHCVGAKVNGRIVPLKTELASGDMVEISVSPSARPSRDWLKLVRTARARSKVRRWLRIEGWDHSVTAGRRSLEEVLRKRHLEKPTPEALETLTKSLGFDNVDHVYAAIGAGDQTAKQIAERLFGREAKPEKTPRSLDRDLPPAHGVRVIGSDNMLVRFAHCCQPVPGDPIVGYVTRGRGITVHRKDCHNTFQISREPERKVRAEWTPRAADRYPVGILVRGTNRTSLLTELSKAISEEETNIVTVHITSDPRVFEGRFMVEVGSAEQLQRILEAAGRVPGVTQAWRDAAPRRKGGEKGKRKKK